MSGPQPPRDIYGVASNCNLATVDYFVSIFGFQEAVELSNIEDPTGNGIDADKIQLALNDAAQLVNNYIESAPPQGKVLIAGSFRRTQATIARFYLDVLRPRTQVQEAAEKALQQLEAWGSKGSPSAGLKWQEAYRYWRSGCSMTKSSYQRGRSFTDPSLNKWVLREGSNDRGFPYANRESPVLNRYSEKALEPETLGIKDVQSDSNQRSNVLFDALETTRSLSSFVNTEDSDSPEDGDGLVADNTTPSADGEFDNYGGLTTEDTF
jgi:phage gp36-like protein